MNQDEAMVKLREQAARVREAGLVQPLMVAPTKVATRVATQVKTEAQRRGHSIGVRVAQKGDAVRVTVTGPYAERYRGAIERALAAGLPQVTTEVRSMITRRAK